MIKLRHCLIVMSLFGGSLLLQSCANQDEHISQQLVLGKTYFKQEQYQKAFVTLEPVAKEGNPDAEYALGFMYYYGRGIAENRPMAKYWMHKAAQHGQASAQKALSKLNDQRDEAPKSEKAQNDQSDQKAQDDQSDEKNKAEQQGAEQQGAEQQGAEQQGAGQPK